MRKLITPYAGDYGHAKGRASKPNVDIKYFPDTESCVRILKVNSLKNQKVVVYHRLYPEPEKRLFELLLILSRVRQETKKIEVFVPYLPYARQDKSHQTGEVVSADVLCELFVKYGVEKLITYDCHFLPRAGNFKRAGLKIENRSAGKALIAYAKKYFNGENFIVIAPDQGSSYFIEEAQGYWLQKKRKRLNKSTVESETHIKKNNFDVKGKNICILDDVIDTGGTVYKTILHLKERGAKKIIVGATHGTFSRPETLRKILKATRGQVFTTNSIKL